MTRTDSNYDVNANTKAYYKLNETSGTSVADSSGNGNTGTASNVSWVAGKFGNAGSFNGSNSQITTASSNLRNFGTSNFTIVCWVNSSSTAAFAGAIANSEGSAGHRRIGVRYFSNNKVTFSARTSSGNFDLDTGVSVNGSWNNVIVTRVSGVFNIYINGVLVLTNNSHTTKNIGKDGTGLRFGFSPEDSDYYSGLIDEVIIEDTARTAQKVLDYYNKSQYRYLGEYLGAGNPVASGLIANYKLDETSGNAADTVGSNTLINANVIYTSGKINNGASFNGTSSNLSIASNLGISTTGDITIAGWIRSDSAITTGRTALHRSSGGGGSAAVQYYVIYDKDTWSGGTPTLRFSRNRDKVGTDWATYATTLTTGTWYHVALTYTGGNVYGYLNGSQVATVGSTGTGTTPDVGDLFELGRYHIRWWNGMIDEAGIWNRALSSTEVATLYNAGNGLQLGTASGTTKGLYHLNGNANDSSGNGKNGTPTNVTWVGGKLGSGAASFNGSNSTINLSAVNIQSATAFTVGMYFKANNVNVLKTLIRFEGKFIIEANGSAKIVFWLRDSGGGYQFNENFTYSADTDYFIMMTHSGTTTNCYVNGVNVGTITGYSVFTGTPGNQHLGSNGGSSAWHNGLIDEVIIENRVWTATEIKKYYGYAKGRFIQ